MDSRVHQEDLETNTIFNCQYVTNISEIHHVSSQESKCKTDFHFGLHKNTYIGMHM